MDYGGMIMISTARSAANIPDAARAHISKRLEANGLHWADLAVTDNAKCID